MWDLGVKEAGYDGWENSVQPGLGFVSLPIRYLRRNTLNEHGRIFHDGRKRKESTPPLVKKTIIILLDQSAHSGHSAEDARRQS